MMKAGHDLISKERMRQIDEEGWTKEHDQDEHTGGDLLLAGLSYGLDVVTRLKLKDSDYEKTAKRAGEKLWPWDEKWWKPTPDNDVRQLVKAGALIAAEIDRLQQPRAQKD
jgi:hypothetical protein